MSDWNGGDADTLDDYDTPLPDAAVAGLPVKNVPEWKEDGNSPKSVTGATSISYTLASDYKYVFIFRDPSNEGMAADVTVNGDTGTNYGYVDEDGTNTTGASAWPLSFSVVNPRILLVADRNTGIRMSSPATASSVRTISGNNGAVTPPINSFTLTDNTGTARDEKIHVYGWNP